MDRHLDATRGGQRVDPAWSSAVEEAARLLEQLGHAVEEASPDGLDDSAYAPSLDTVYRAATGWLLGYWRRRMGRPPADGEIEPQTRAWESSRRSSAAEYLLAVEALRRISRRVAAWFETYDAWLTPTLGAGPLGRARRHRARPAARLAQRGHVPDVRR